MLYLIGSIFLIGRLMHGITIGFMKYSPFLRVNRTLLTFLCILVISSSNITEVI